MQSPVEIPSALLIQLSELERAHEGSIKLLTELKDCLNKFYSDFNRNAANAYLDGLISKAADHDELSDIAQNITDHLDHYVGLLAAE